MNKLTSILLSALLVLTVQTTFAQSQEKDNNANQNSSVSEYDFENNSYNVSDEQLHIESGEESLQKDLHESFWTKLLNSSHFSSSTATKTWTPLNKAE